MKEDEYKLLIHDPSDFWMRTYIPRVFGAFESWKHLNPFTSIIETPAAWFMPYTQPDLQAAAPAPDLREVCSGQIREDHRQGHAVLYFYRPADREPPELLRLHKFSSYLIA